jgi:hypothetical protein
MMNSDPSILDSKEPKKYTATMSPLKLPPSIGSPKEPSKPSKTKDNVDLVGLSLPPPHLNPPNSYLSESSEISLNNNSSLALPLMETTDVQEV